MSIRRRTLLHTPLLAAPFLAPRRAGAQAESFPSHAVRVIVPYTPGGSADIAARLLAEPLSKQWGQPVVVENRAGANGIIGTDVVAKAPPDGHTLAMISVNHAVNVPLYTTPFDTLKDLTALTVVYSVPLLLVAAPDFPASTPQQLAELARRKEGSISFAGTGGAVHLAAEMFAARAGAKMTHVPYRGSTAAHPDLMAGRVDRIVLSRPAVEAGERLGFLPGDMKEKVDPYLRPLYDALHDMMPAEQVTRRIATGEIEVAPLAFMRGRTLAHSFAILDEAQNTTPAQMKMFLTRMGEGTRMVITGDPTQVDLPPGQSSGLVQALGVLEGVEGIGVTRFAEGDVVRHPLVGRIVAAYARFDAKDDRAGAMRASRRGKDRDGPVE